MQLENLVCSLELAKRLCELGVKESIFCWGAWENPLAGIFEEKDADREDRWIVIPTNQASKSGADWRYPAPTAAELGEMLPKNCYTRKYHSNKKPAWECHYIQKGGDEVEIQVTEADARAKMLIYLLENNLIKLGDKE